MAYTKEDIITRAKDLAKMIAETEEVDLFKKAEAQINQNSKIQQTIAQIKALQKQAVNYQHFGKQEALKKVEEKIDALQDELDNIPVVQDFKSSQMDVNDLLQIVAATISNTVTDEIIESTGGNVLRGETGSKVNGSSGSCGDGCGCH
ncbi:RicAFT regulatory complex protein RicA family protein [Bacillus salitolerans]|uniref:RicAFT regulatory complex protein RicA family protein n=1 Tax=Bacillus salitolerans TaxID=1437434 RepID=A0ABW4LN11_9BACI